MSRELVNRLLRRGLVLGASIAVITAAVGTVKVAADWRAADAPLDVAPVGVETINAQLVSETDRAGVLVEEIDAVAAQIADLQSAVASADQQVTDDTESAQVLEAELAAAAKKLETLQGQLKAANERLSALNRAAARQAAANAAAKSSSRGGGEPEDDGDEHDD
jgi:septal ring factor EnvC (AmiA/AmiB activator)